MTSELAARRAVPFLAPAASAWLRSFLPGRTAVNGTERLRACCGALLGIGLTAVLSYWALGQHVEAIWLLAPMGASSVLLFALPASPLAQPWSILGGNMSAAVIGVACARYVALPLPAAALAVGLAIGAMFALRCLHPPSGAVALTAVLGGPAIHASGFGFALVPVGLNSLILLLTALIYNNLTGRRYPHTQRSAQTSTHQTRDAVPSARLGFSSADLDQALARYNQVLDISRDDLEAILQDTERRAHSRRFGDLRCAQIMSSDVVAVEFGTGLDQAWSLLRQHRINALPVINRARRVTGIVTRSDFLRHAQLVDYAGSRGQFERFIRRSLRSHTSRPEVVGQIMQQPVTLAHAAQAIAELVPLLADRGIHQVPVVDAEQRLCGMITQADLIAALFEAGLQQA